MSFPLMPIFPVSNVSPGSQTFTANGNFVVPPYNLLTVKLWGAGGEGGPISGGTVFGGNGSATTFQGMTAGGGYGGRSGGSPSGNDGSGNGGAASGGDTNTSGNSATTATGKGAPNGGGDQASHQAAGTTPGGGGAGGDGIRIGGGSGAYCEKVYSPGDLTIGASLAVTIGAGGTGQATGGDGARGEAQFIWT